MAKSLGRIKRLNIEIVEGNEVKEKEIIISKAPLGKWKSLTESMKKLFNLLPEVLEGKGITEKEEMEAYFEQMTTQDLLLLLPDMMEVAFDEVINILALGSNVDRDFIAEQVGIDEAVDMLEAIIEVNKLVKVVEKGKNLMGILPRK